MNKQLSETYGERIRTRREAIGMSREMLGDRSGRTAATVSNWESSKVTPPRTVRVLLASLLNDSTLIEVQA